MYGKEYLICRYQERLAFAFNIFKEFMYVVVIQDKQYDQKKYKFGIYHHKDGVYLM